MNPYVLFAVAYLLGIASLLCFTVPIMASSVRHMWAKWGWRSLIGMPIYLVPAFWLHALWPAWIAYIVWRGRKQ